MSNDPASSPAIYFHGLPGSAGELELAALPTCSVPEVLDPLDFEAFDQRNDPDASIRVIGFSLGAFSALKLAASRPESVSELILISPAAPLEIGQFLDQMAGAPIFKLAKGNSFAFAAVTAVQALAAHTIPGIMLNQMFAKSCDAEKALLNTPDALSCLKTGLQHSFGKAAPRYRRAVTEYVQPWESELSKVQCPCQVFHGELDDWVPVAMAQALYDRLPPGSKFQVENGLGHYSTLIKVLPNVLNGSVHQS